MTTSELLTKDVPLPKLEAFCQNLGKALHRAGVPSDIAGEIWRTGLDARCVECDIRIYGEELLTLSEPVANNPANTKRGRLHLGDCARQGCNAYSYRLTFYPCLNLNWPELLAAANTPENSAPEESRAETKAMAGAWTHLLRLRAIRATAITVAAITLLLVFRQWYNGGRIPLLREPRKFTVSQDSVHPPAR